MPGRVAVELRDPEERYGSLYLPQGAGDKPIHGTVLQTCAPYSLDGAEYEPLFQKGDIVIFGRWTGTEVNVRQGNTVKKILIIREKDVLCRLHNVKPEDLVLDAVKISERE